MKRKLGMNTGCIGGEDPVVTLGRMKKVGFETFFSGFNDLEGIERLKNEAEKLGMEFEFIHAPFRHINPIWLPGDEYRDLYDKMLASIDAASACGVKTVIIHVSSGFHPPEICDLGLKRYDDLVEYAEKKNVIVAFENLRKVGNISYFVDRYAKTDNVRFCYDCGHEHCYTVTVCFPDIFRDKILCTHIHDNFGFDYENPEADRDAHLLPFDGNIDYVKMMRKLDEYKYSGSLMLEVSNAPYPNMTPDEFVSTAFERIKRISEL